MAVRVSASGTAVGAPVEVAAGARPDVAYARGEFLVVWEQPAETFVPGVIRAQRVTRRASWWTRHSTCRSAGSSATRPSVRRWPAT